MIKAWLAKVIHNLAADSLRDAARRCEQPASLLGLRQGDCERAALAAEAVRRALERLSCDQRRAVILCMIHGLSSRDAASVMGRSGGSVRRWLSEARVILRENLGTLVQQGGEMQ